MEAHVAQDVKMVLMNVGGYELAEGGENVFTVGQKDCLRERGYMNSSNNNTGGWSVSERRTWSNGTYRNSFPSTLVGIFKQFKVIAATGNGAGKSETDDFFTLPAEMEIFGTNTWANSTTESVLSQFDWYKTVANRFKEVGNNDEKAYWERSHSSYSGFFCNVNGINGTADHAIGYSNLGISPFGCIGKKVSA